MCLISALLCVVLLLVLCSLLRGGIRGVRDWCVANAIAFVAFVLYAYGRELPPLIGYEITNGVYAAATAAMLVGFRRFFGKKIPWTPIFSTVGLLVALVALFHYVIDSFAMRTLAVSISQLVFQLGIARTIIGARRNWRSRYPYLFTAGMAAVVAAGNLVRAVTYAAYHSELGSLLQPSYWNLLFMTFGAMVLPVLTMGAVMMVHDRMMAKAEDAANHDFLTGAWTRRAFFKLAERELARAARLGTPLSLLVLDVDHFKSINDRLGHSAGDEVLVDVVLRAEMIVRGTDCFARIGGEEFAMLMPDTGLQDGLTVAERLRKALELPDTATAAQAGRDTAPYTVSIGIAQLEKNESFPGLLHRADAALYKAKQSGRNLVVASA